MTATTITSQPRGEGKQKGMFKKVIKYLQDQATENSNPRSVLSPPGLEPHQKSTLQQQQAQYDEMGQYLWNIKRLSDATTAVEQRRPGAMAGDGADAGVYLETVSPDSREMKKVQYAQDNILQNYKLYIPDRNPEDIQGNQFWIIYIHGGYFRDPKVDAASFRPALEILTLMGDSRSQSDSLPTVPESSEPSPVSSRGPFAREFDLIHKHIAGYASVNYRLAPHPGYTQNERTENYVKRDAHFPEQLQDVHAAIRHLQTRHDIGSNYILAGHSVGATLAFLAALKAREGQIDPPTCIVGLNGIYDFPGLHQDHPEYEPMTKNAINPDQYPAASPALYSQADFSKILPKQTLRVLLSHSKKDGLVPWNQVEKMGEALRTSDVQPPPLQVQVIETKGPHDSTWKEGRELARILVEGLEMTTAY